MKLNYLELKAIKMPNHPTVLHLSPSQIHHTSADRLWQPKQIIAPVLGEVCQ